MSGFYDYNFHIQGYSHCNMPCLRWFSFLVHFMLKMKVYTVIVCLLWLSLIYIYFLTRAFMMCVTYGQRLLSCSNKDLRSDYYDANAKSKFGLEKRGIMTIIEHCVLLWLTDRFMTWIKVILIIDTASLHSSIIISKERIWENHKPLPHSCHLCSPDWHAA